MYCNICNTKDSAPVTFAGRSLFDIKKNPAPMKWDPKFGQKIKLFGNEFGIQPDSSLLVWEIFSHCCSKICNFPGNEWIHPLKKTFSIAPLSKQFPFLDRLCIILRLASNLWYSFIWYCQPWSERKIGVASCGSFSNKSLSIFSSAKNLDF